MKLLRWIARWWTAGPPVFIDQPKDVPLVQLELAKECPQCFEWIKARAHRCKYCTSIV